MRPAKRGRCKPDQTFDSDESLYRRIPPDGVGPHGELVPSSFQCSFGDEINKSPSVIRSKYGTPRDALHSNCARGNDVSHFHVYYLLVSEIPCTIESGDGRTFNFFPFHDPEDNCYAHTVIGCRTEGAAMGAYSEPTRGVRNKFKAQLIAALKMSRPSVFPRTLMDDARKYLTTCGCPKD